MAGGQILNPVLYEEQYMIEMMQNARPGQEIEQALMVPIVPAEAYDPQKKREKKLQER